MAFEDIPRKFKTQSSDMGGSLSSSKERNLKRYSSERQRRQHPKIENTKQQEEGKQRLFQFLSARCEEFQQSRNVSEPLHKRILQHSLAANWSPMPANKEYMLVTLSQKSSEYKDIKNLFKSSTKKHYSVSEIKRVQNPFLLGYYLLKKHEMKVIYGKVTEQLVFHGTKETNVTKICEDNFNWRLHGDSAGNTYGQGVSFSPISYYSSHYSCQDKEIKVMFVVRMLLHEAVVGSGNMILPPQKGYGNTRYDTAAKENGHVFVKFYDNEFYPQYLIYYKGSPDSRSKNKMDENYLWIVVLLLLAYFWYLNAGVHYAK